MDSNHVIARSSSPEESPELVSIFVLAGALAALLLGYLGALILSAAAVWMLTERILGQGANFLEGGLLLTGITVMGVLTFILAKGLFRHKGADRSEFIEVTAETDPEFFEFLSGICDRAGARMPHRVYACPDVNAGVFFDISFWNLFLPTRKNLLIGLGMVEALNRTELEAVLAHEFGHFSQFSMRLSHYVQVVTAILDGLIHDRDGVDRAVRGWGEKWHRGLMLGPLYLLLSRVVRSTGATVRLLLGRLDGKVSREMELQADAVAVALTGSDALIHALLRTDWAERCHAQTLYDLEQAAREGWQSDDLYYHQRALSEKMRERLGDPSLGMPPELSSGEEHYQPVFGNGSELARADVWETHPSHQVREARARRNYRRSEFDRRSAWTLFDHPERLKETLTGRLYEKRWNMRGQAVDARRVQAHIDGEHDEIVLRPVEQAVYGHRFLEPGDLESAVEEARGCEHSAGELREWLERLTGPLLEEAAERIARHLPSSRPSSTLGAGAKSLRGSRRSGEEEREIFDPEEDRRWLAEWDREVLIAQVCAAERVGPERAEELIRRYRFHLHLQDLIRWMRAHSGQFPQVIAALESEELNEELLEQVFSVLHALHGGLKAGLEDGPATPGFHGVEEGAYLETLVFAEGLIDAGSLREGKLNSAWLQGFIDHWQEAGERLRHLRLKSLGALLRSGTAEGPQP